MSFSDQNIIVLKKQLADFVQLLIQSLLLARGLSDSVYGNLFSIFGELMCYRDEFINYRSGLSKKSPRYLIDVPGLRCQSKLYHALSISPPISVSIQSILNVPLNMKLLRERPLINEGATPRWSIALDDWIFNVGSRVESEAGFKIWEKFVPFRVGEECRDRYNQLRNRSKIEVRHWKLKEDLLLYSCMRGRRGWQGAWLAFDGSISCDDLRFRWSAICKVHSNTARKSKANFSEPSNILSQMTASELEIANDADNSESDWEVDVLPRLRDA